MLNFGAGVHTLALSEVAAGATVALATDMVRSGAVDLSDLALGRNEALVLRLT